MGRITCAPVPYLRLCKPTFTTPIQLRDPLGIADVVADPIVLANVDENLDTVF